MAFSNPLVVQISLRLLKGCSFILLWAFGGALTSDNRITERILAFLKSLFTKGFKFPDADLVFDYFIDFSSGEVMLWSDKLYSYAAASGDGFQSSIFVPTTNTIRLRHLLDILVNNDHPVMFVGSAGTGNCHCK